MANEAAHTALIFPAAGSHWPGMAADIEHTAQGRWLIARAEAALAELGVLQGKLQSVMAGDDQAARARNDDGWTWTGDYALSCIAQTVVSVAHAQRFIQQHGPPAAMLGESLGELAAYCVAGAMSIEEAVLTTYQWARALVKSSEKMGAMRIGLLVRVARNDLEELCAPCDARVVIYEALNQFAVALPRAQLPVLEKRARAIRGRFLVSVQPCAAHDGRLAADEDAWVAYRAWLDSIRFEPPSIEIRSTIAPGQILSEPAALRDNLFDTGTHTIHWAEAISRLFWFPEQRQIKTLVQPCCRTDAYVLERLRPQNIIIKGVRIEAAGTLDQIDSIF